MRLKDSPDCSYTINHFFLFCPEIEESCHSVFNWLNRLREIQDYLTGEEFILVPIIGKDCKSTNLLYLTYKIRY